MSTPGHRTVPGASYFVTTKCWEGAASSRSLKLQEIHAQHSLSVTGLFIRGVLAS